MKVLKSQTLLLSRFPIKRLHDFIFQSVINFNSIQFLSEFLQRTLNWPLFCDFFEKVLQGFLFSHCQFFKFFLLPFSLFFIVKISIRNVSWDIVKDSIDQILRIRRHIVKPFEKLMLLIWVKNCLKIVYVNSVFFRVSNFVKYTINVFIRQIKNLISKSVKIWNRNVRSFRFNIKK